MKFNPIAASILLSLPVIVQAANLNIKNGTLFKANGVPIINIAKPNENGLSHNVYDDFNVGKDGVIFNNSSSGTNTVIGGSIAGNSNLTSGSANVILNEVTSNKSSMLEGLMEVAGDKAHLVIANPNGISTTMGSGFINTSKATITTGKPDIQNGALKGYSVGGGIINVQGLMSSSPTEILARSVAVQGQIVTDELTVIAGNNYINENAAVSGHVTASGARNTYAVDVSDLGGMYANRINLISTESGVGVRNTGIIAGGADNIVIDVNGKFINSNGNVQAVGETQITTNGALDNIGGDIAGKGKILINTAKNVVNNTTAGSISSEADIYIDSGEFNNKNGKVASSGVLGINTNGKTLTNTGKGTAVGLEAGVVALKTGKLDNRTGQIKGGYLAFETSELTNVGGEIQSAGKIDMISSGNIDNTKGLIRSQAGGIQIETAKSFINKENITADATSSDSLGLISGDGGIKVKAGVINNSTGGISSSGSISLASDSTINNGNGKIAADKSVSLSAIGNIENSSGRVLSKDTISVVGSTMDNSLYVGQIIGDRGIKIDLTGYFNNHIGLVSSQFGNVDIEAKNVKNIGGMILGKDISIKTEADVDNYHGLMVASNVLNIDAKTNVNNSYGENFGKVYGNYFGIPGQIGGLIGSNGVSINAQSVNNNHSRIIAEYGPLTMNVLETLSSDRALIASGSDANIIAKRLTNNYSTIHSAGDLNIDVNSLSNYSTGTIESNDATGIISSDRHLSLIVGSAFTNYGWVSSKQNSLVRVAGVLHNYNTISADNTLEVDTSGTLTNEKDIVAGTILYVESDGNVVNSSKGNLVGSSAFIKAGTDLTNYGNVVAWDYLDVQAARTIYNYKNIYTQGNAFITSKMVHNSGANAILGGERGVILNTEQLTGSGTIVGL
ncbi:filamentous hemagglutinin N-terminal domain-containing protein [Kosakonia sp. SMBL-WEM22]|uniref:two-partner secretion domain-containing protein n=1 Tax=Kosakonia sp. SMBL-WEM22 TaxID=2725560 RepID=UPI001CB98A98|nr:filamentous hemagglutinin N-terminal domain-containing protein [Kosakonia sp. SMBL-WEM22]